MDSLDCFKEVPDEVGIDPVQESGRQVPLDEASVEVGK
jgi:hypothetical protein